MVSQQDFIDIAFKYISIEYALSTINCTIILIDTRSIFNFTDLIPRHAVDIQLRFTIYDSDFTIVERKLEVSKYNHTFYTNFSNSKVPRIVYKIKDLFLTTNCFILFKATISHLKI